MSPEEQAQVLASLASKSKPPKGIAAPKAPVPQELSVLDSPLLPVVGRAGYSHQAMVDLMVLRPDYNHTQLCAHFGRPASWLSSVLASETFQQTLDAHRHEVADPALTATLGERFRALAIRTSNMMMTKMDGDEVTDFMVLKAGEIAIKALGMGQKPVEAPPPPALPSAPTMSLAEKLLAAMDQHTAKQTVDVDVTDITPNGTI